MSDVNGNSSINEILAFINEKNEEINKLVEKSESNPTESILSEAKTIYNNCASLLVEKQRVMNSEGDNDEIDANAKEEIQKLIEQMNVNIDKIKANIDTKTNASEAISSLMNDKTFQQIEEIEKQIMYRKYYFPGGIPKLRIPGTGANKESDDFEYDQSNKDADPFDHWDPRYINEYIRLAKQNGFHRHFVYYNGADFKTISFTQALDILKKCVNWNNGTIDESGACDKFEVCGIIGGLIYFDKYKTFIEETGIAGGKTSLFQRVWTANNDMIELTIEKLENGLIQQSRYDFKNNNYGWMASSNKYAFDSEEYLSKWIELENEYEKYKDKIWKILEQTDTLQLCTNKVNVTGNNISIQQEMQCLQSVENKNINEEKEKDDNKDDEYDENESNDEKKNDINEGKNENEMNVPELNNQNK